MANATLTKESVEKLGQAVYGPKAKLKIDADAPDAAKTAQANVRKMAAKNRMDAIAARLEQIGGTDRKHLLLLLVDAQNAQAAGYDSSSRIILEGSVRLANEYLALKQERSELDDEIRQLASVVLANSLKYSVAIDGPVFSSVRAYAATLEELNGKLLAQKGKKS